MSTTTTDDTVTINRRLKAPWERVFCFLSSAEGMKQWMGPGDVKVVECVADFRQGGGYSVKMTSPKFGEMTVVGVYREIIVPEKVVYTWKWEDDEDWAGCESVVTIELMADGAETELRLRHRGFPVPQNRENHLGGWMACLEKLDTAVAS